MVNLTQKIVIRQVKPEDAEAIWEIRNTPIGRSKLVLRSIIFFSFTMSIDHRETTRIEIF